MINSQLEIQFRELQTEHSLQTEKVQQSSAEQIDELNMLRKDKELFHMETEVSSYLLLVTYDNVKSVSRRCLKRA